MEAGGIFFFSVLTILFELNAISVELDKTNNKIVFWMFNLILYTSSRIIKTEVSIIIKTLFMPVATF